MMSSMGWRTNTRTGKKFLVSRVDPNRVLKRSCCPSNIGEPPMIVSYSMGEGKYGIRIGNEEGVMLDFPDVRQNNDVDCGVAAIQSILAFFGLNLGESDILHLIGKESDISYDEILLLAYQLGLKYKCADLTIDELKESVGNNQPVLIAIQAWGSKDPSTPWSDVWDSGHFVVVIGYTEGKIIFEDPWTFERGYIEYGELKERWHDCDYRGKEYGNYGCIFMGKPTYRHYNIAHIL